MNRDLSRISDIRSKLVKIHRIDQESVVRTVGEFTKSFRLFHYSVIVPTLNHYHDIIITMMTNSSGGGERLCRTRTGKRKDALV